jgi:hypothetical protein
VVLVDTTVWVDHLKNTVTPEVAWLRHAILHRTASIAVGDLVLCEVLQGLSTEREAALVEQALRRFDVLSLVTPDLATQSAAHYRNLRRRGVTVRKTIDMLIGTFCITHGHALLHTDRDFDQLERHLGLRVVHP